MPLFRSNSCDKAARKNQPLGRDGLPARPAKPKTAGDPANPAYVAVADVEDVQACNVLDHLGSTRRAMIPAAAHTARASFDFGYAR